MGETEGTNIWDWRLNIHSFALVSLTCSSAFLQWMFSFWVGIFIYFSFDFEYDGGTECLHGAVQMLCLLDTHR